MEIVEARLEQAGEAAKGLIFDFRTGTREARPMDIFTPENRSEVMSRIRGRNTKPEIALRSMLHRLGFRFTVNGPNNRKLTARPDIVLPKYRTLILVHGCFWHGHENCPHFRLPKSRTEWWTAKISGNKARDLRNEAALRGLGWRVITIWECEMKTRAAAELRSRLPQLIRHQSIRYELPDESPMPMAAEDVAEYRS